MDLFNIITILIVLSAAFAYLNIRFLKMPATIGLMVISIVATLGVILVGTYSDCCLSFTESFIAQIDFRQVLLDVMLSFLLFAGALHTDWSLLKKQRLPILTFATFGVLVSTLLIGSLFYWLLGLLEFEIDYIYCLLFGALISPTDPIAVLGIMKDAKVPKKLEIKIVGESLFNDGIGVVVFLTLFNIASKGIANVEAGEIALLFAEEVIGGIALGLGLGFLAYRLMKSIDNYETEVMITLAVVMGGSLLATTLHFSAPLAVVVAGLFIGNKARRTAISKLTERYLDKFWELVDVLLNAVLFVLIGMELIIINFSSDFVLLGLLAIPLVLLVRFAVVAPPLRLFRRKLDFVPRSALIMTWGGLRGGISIALALSLTETMPRDLILSATYIVVIFSIVVQGLTLKKLIQKLKTK